MFCPLCHAEYRPGFHRCADCDVDLVYELPAAAIVPTEPIAPGDPDEDPFVSFWKGDDPRLHAELCQLLTDHGIPHRTIRRQDHLFNINTSTAFEIGIPFSQFDRAEAIVQEAYTPDAADTGAGGPHAPRALPESTISREPGAPWAPQEWFPEDATVQIWEGQPLEMAELLAASLSENRIHSRVANTGSTQRLFVLPEDESHARQIVREVVEGVPPE